MTALDDAARAFLAAIAEVARTKTELIDAAAAERRTQLGEVES